MLLYLPHCHYHLTPHSTGMMMTQIMQDETSSLTSLTASSCALLIHLLHLSLLCCHHSWSPAFDTLLQAFVPGKLGSLGLLSFVTTPHFLHLMSRVAGYAAAGTGQCYHLLWLLDHCAAFQHSWSAGPHLA